MKIKQITIQNYKKFVEPFTCKFTDSLGLINEQTLLIGDNGTGKTSILQAIVAVIATLTRQNFNLKNLDWLGFNANRIQTGKSFLKIEVEITFEEEETAATYLYAQELKKKGNRISPMPSQEKNIILSLDFANGTQVKSNFGLEGIRQFSGYQYAKQLASVTDNKQSLFDAVGNIYWYDEQRNTNAVTDFLANKGSKSLQIDDIRRMLGAAYLYHEALNVGKRQLQEGKFDVYKRLSDCYTKIFRGRKLLGPDPHFDIDELDKTTPFLLHDGKREYELSEISAGERAVLPILLNFAYLNINHSIILVDELELHLHPPLQQAFVRIMKLLGKNNQFIFTSHSSDITSMFNEAENQIIRLK